MRTLELPRAGMLCLALVACSGEITSTDKEEEPDLLESFGVDSLVPQEGPSSGGTQLLIEGSGFTDGTTVTVGGSACGALSFISSTELTCITAGGSAGSAVVELTRTEDGATATDSFAYTDDGGTDDGGTDDGGTDDGGTDDGGTDDGGSDGSDDTGGSGSGSGSGSDDTGTDDGGSDGSDDGSDDTGVVVSPVDYCHLQWPCSTTASAGGTTESLYAWVYHSGTTDGAGEGSGVTVEFGVGSDGSDPSAGGWSWETASYNADKDGLSSGDLANDEYTGTLTAPSSAASYDYCARVSIDGGSSWTYCDFGGDGCGYAGSDDGYSTSETGALTVE